MISIMSPELAVQFDRLRGGVSAYRAGEAVFHLGDVVRRMFVVRSGTIHLVRHQRGGSAVILQRAGRVDPRRGVPLLGALSLRRVGRD